MLTLLAQLFSLTLLLVAPALPDSSGLDAGPPEHTARAEAARPAAAPYSAASAGVSLPATDRRVRLWTHVGRGVIHQQYGPQRDRLDVGEAVPLPTSLRAMAGGLGLTVPLPEGVDGTVSGAGARVSGTLHVTTLHLGGAYALRVRPAYTITVGADLGLSQQRFESERLTFDLDAATVTIPALGYTDVPLADVATQLGLELPASVPAAERVESGFEVQSLMAFASYERRHVAVRAGYHADLGPARDLAAGRRENTDGQDAWVAGVSAQRPAARYLLFAGADAYLTRGGTATDDRGHLVGLHAGAGYRLGAIEAGTALTFRYRTEGTLTGYAVPAGYHVGLAPFVAYTPRDGRFSALLRGGVQDEYRDYTLSLQGENDLAPRLGATLSLSYAL